MARLQHALTSWKSLKIIEPRKLSTGLVVDDTIHEAAVHGALATDQYTHDCLR